ncbi:Gfo/Idh/MocA family protein [Halobellus ordinarius]|uniref:Gfo/Idh/MocA family protein n=1 Tax=Halobellus ordinarius TaxID=3075120 RepID=UPI0028804F85|nr:Gfo/Idh/MocA family oxidoreductase [Halobellus sp. ZY16]
MGVTETALVVGGGSIGRRHTRNLQRLGIKVAVVDPVAEVRTELATELGVKTFAELSNGLDSENPDIAVVCTPNRFHIHIAAEAARAGCHLFIEKPLSDRMDGVAELEAVVSEQDLISLVGCNLRFHPEIKKIHKLLQNDVIGPIVAARIEVGSYLPDWFPDTDYRESYSARKDLGGGVILDCIHEINYARWFFDEFHTVSAMAGQQSQLEIETNDVAGILAKTSKGTICEFHLDYVQREYSRSCHIIGEEGTIRWSWSDEQVEWYVSKEDTWYSFDRPGDWTMNDMYVDEMEHFLSSVQTGEETICPISCGWNDLAVALAARKSATTGRHVSPATLRE